MINDAARSCGGGRCVTAASVRVVVVVMRRCDDRGDEDAAAGGFNNNRNSGKEPRVYHMMEFLGNGCQVCVRVKGQLLTKNDADDRSMSA